MNETERKQIKGALLKCADENENKVTPTFYVTVSSVCKSAVERIEELEAQIEKMKCCSNCDNWNWKHSRCEKKLKGDCFKQGKWVLRKILSKEYE